MRHLLASTGLFTFTESETEAFGRFSPPDGVPIIQSRVALFADRSTVWSPPSPCAFISEELKPSHGSVPAPECPDLLSGHSDSIR